jgi:hypothetical protein
MTTTEYELLLQLQARILAQEMFMRTVLAAALMNTADPLGGLEEMRADQERLATQGTRPMGKYEDEVWELALKTFNSELDQVAHRLSAHPTQPSGGSTDQVAPPPKERASAPPGRAYQDA